MPHQPNASKPDQTTASRRRLRPAAAASDGSAALAAAERHCLTHGLKLTAGRKAVLQALLRRGGKAKAYELLTDLQAGGAAGAPMAVYRALDFLVSNDLVHKVASNSSFVVCQHPHPHHHEPSFLICERCGSATEWDAEGCQAVVAQALQGSGFAVHGIEIQGVCAGCVSGSAIDSPTKRDNA